MAGAYRMALSRATVVASRPGEDPVTHRGVNVSVRDGVARIASNVAEIVTMPMVELDRQSSRSYTITGPDGQVWAVSKRCNCGGAI